MKSQNSKSKTRGGFSLLEVVVAMAIVGLGVVTLLEVFSLALRLAARSADTTEAITYGRLVMDEILTRREIEEGSEEGSSGKKYRWRVQVTPAQEEPNALSASGWEVKEIALEIRYRDGMRERQLEMKTLRVVKRKGP